MSPKGDAILRVIGSQKPSPVLLCRNCLSSVQQQRRRLSASPRATAEVAAPLSDNNDTTLPSESTQTSNLEDPAVKSLAARSHKIRCGVLLSRPPQLTRELTPFEKAFFLYQRRLNERLALPFTRYFYYGKNSPGEVEWKRKIKERLTPAREIGRYSGYGREAWNDEVLVGDTLGEPENQREALVRDSEVEVKQRNELGEDEIIKEEAERPMPRRTVADEEGDLRSLNRALTRTLYLLVKRKRTWSVPGKGDFEREEWGFPTVDMKFDEALHYAARRAIAQSGGPSMNTWVVGKIPICHQVLKHPRPVIDKVDGSEKLGEKIFYMKARIMAGKATVEDNPLGLLDYQWLARDEIQKVISPFDWNSVKNVLAER